MKRLIIITLAILLFTSTAFASTWCQWVEPDSIGNCVTATILPSGTEVITLGNGARVSGADSNKWDAGYYKLQTISPALQEFQVYSGYVYSFADNIITKTRQIVGNYDGMTLNEAKWDKYWSLFNANILPIREQDCVYSGFIVPDSARQLMVEAVAAGKTVTYEVYNESNGMPNGFERTSAQAKAILDACLTPLNNANLKMYVDDGTGSGKADQIMACADADCVNSITW